MSEVTSKEAVNMAYNGQASEFRDAVSDLLMNKIQDAVGMKKAEVAQTFMAPETTEAE
jgi:hypothetical protein